MRVCGYCDTPVVQKRVGGDEFVDFCPKCKQVVEGTTKKLATCYFCDKPITDKEKRPVYIAESPKDYEAGGIRVWVCKDCETRTQEDR